ncbi:cytochrome c [Diaphorobacter sp. HDW4A]|uniref:c-type cytochrome n=1 Tax=Diaphorobacter sp. HDW4A TaxID=2714924 RepID=UPI00140D066B|nr:cytochrome c [Diaphorobacter sp. HDW4A]QIL81414.1 cytochrome c [Diaphorobacter sp. HDW4A]
MSEVWAAWILEWLLAAQFVLRDGLHALGLTPLVAGQPGWPFAERLSAEMMWIDPGHARRVAITGICVVVAVFFFVIAIAVALWCRRVRSTLIAGLMGVAFIAVLAAPWPASHLLWVPAVPTSLHRSDSGFQPAGIMRGQALFQQNCAQCHGADARGQGPLASTLGRWPPDLTGGLLWKRLEGELFWRVRHGMRDERLGRETMPGASQTQLSDADIWQMLDYLQARASGQSLRDLGAWERPVRMPSFALRCRYGAQRRSDGLKGQRVLLVLPSRTPLSAPPEDPRMVSVTVRASVDVVDFECLADDAQLLPALALLLGEREQDARGFQLLADRDGWLRARSAPGRSAWSEDDFVCRTGVQRADKPVADANAQGLDALLRRMDDNPVKPVRAGFPH